MNDPYDEGDEEIPAISVKRKKKKPKTAEDWASFSGWDIYLYGGLDTEETAFYSSIEPELAAELLQSELDSMKEKRKRRGCKGRRSEMRRRDGRSNAPLTPQEQKLLDELSPPAERFEPGAWPDAQTRPMRMTRPSPETTHGDLLSEAGRNDCADEELPF